MPVVALGHSNQPPKRFLETLQAHRVQRLLDIRRHPGSRHVPWTHPQRLQELLETNGIDYEHVPAMGGRRKPVPGSVNDAWRNDAFRGYADHMQSQEFQDALSHLTALAARQNVAILCAEAVPWRCHRRLVADALVARGVPVMQAFSPTDARPHEMTPFAQVDEGRVTYPGSHS